ncbi:MetC Cystathionine beta-lyases/cystathionine gamma-synthases [Candidatus Nanopelagicaceae bacterium]
MSDDRLHPETIAISSGRPAQEPGAGLNPSISLNSTFSAGGPINYGRTGNETWQQLEAAISALEEAQSTLVFSSGMAAIAAVFSILPNGAPIVASHEGYSGTMALLKKYNQEGRLEVRFVDITDTKEVVDKLQGAAFLWIESPTNPGLGVADVAVIVGEAKKRNIGVGFDNTFATPINQKPLTFGADIVMHSVTKYLAGHSDLILGSLSVKDPALNARLHDARTSLGSIAGPFEVWLALRGIRTFPIRFQRAQESAGILAKKLASHPSVTNVRYPGFGAIISFEAIGDVARAEKICSASSLIANATSLGGVETTWERRRRWELESHSVPENLIRLSVGCEHVDDLWREIDTALKTQ